MEMRQVGSETNLRYFYHGFGFDEKAYGMQTFEVLFMFLMRRSDYWVFAVMYSDGGFGLLLFMFFNNFYCIGLSFYFDIFLEK